MWYLNVGFPRKSICRRSFRFICHYLPLSVFGLHYVVLYPWNSIKIRHTYVFKCPYLSIVVIYITQVRFIWTLNSILYIITTCVCVRPTGQFRVLMDQRNRPGRSDSENGNRPEQSDSENGNPGPNDWCAASFVKTKRRKSQGEFTLLLNKSNHDFLVDFFGGCHSQDHWELQKLKRKLLSWSTNYCRNSKESISFMKKLRRSISRSAIAAAETKNHRSQD